VEHKRRYFIECPSCSFPYTKSEWGLGFIALKEAVFSFFGELML